MTTSGPGGLVAVTGMHRGGTSALARALNILGLGVGDPARLMPATPDNPGGYWENLRVAQLHDELLGVLGGWWAAPPVLPEHWQHDPSLSPFQTWLAQIIQDHYEPHGRCLVKDPRLSLLLPFWRTLVPVEWVVIGVRDPVEVVDSLVRRDGLDPEHAAWLWLRHLDAVAVGEPTAVVVDYADWFAAPDDVVDRLVRGLGLPTPTSAVRDRVTGWITPELRRAGRGGVTAGPFAAAAAAAHAALREAGLPGLRRVTSSLPVGWHAAPPQVVTSGR